MKDKTIQAASTSVHRVSQATTGAASRATAHVHKQSTELVRHTLQKLWWWSLAAVAIYGLVTTLPAAYLRHLRESKQIEQSASGAKRSEDGFIAKAR